jgi:hypothetical protein
MDVERAAESAAWAIAEKALGPDRLAAHCRREFERRDRLRALAAIGADLGLAKNAADVSVAVLSYMTAAFGENVEFEYFSLKDDDPARFDALAPVWWWWATRNLVPPVMEEPSAEALGDPAVAVPYVVEVGCERISFRNSNRRH